jgi:hypothetical protein
MVVEAQLGMDFPYNDRLRERNRLLSQMDVITHNPQLLGGGRLRDIALSGNSGAYPMDHDRLMELKAMGGAFNLTKFLRPTMKVLKSKEVQSVVKPVADELLRQGVRRVVGGKINRLKKAKRWTQYSVDTISKGLDLGSKAKKLFGYGELEDVARMAVRRGRKVARDPITQEVVARLRKAPIVKQAVRKVKSIIGSGELEDVARMVVRRGRKVAQDPLAQEVVARLRKTPLARKAVAKVKSIVGGGRAARAAIVKKVMKDHGLGMIEASSFVKKNGLY